MQPQSAIAPPDPKNLPYEDQQPPINKPQRGTLLFLYGASTEKEFRLRTKPLSSQLAKLGLRVLVFDYRGNAPGNDSNDFGMHDRIEDAKRMIEYMRKLCNPPYTLVGSGTGGYIAVKAVAETDPTLFENIVLISPVAYRRTASEPGVLFRHDEHKRKHTDLLETDAFKSAEIIDTNWLLMSSVDDTMDTRKITTAWFASLGRKVRQGRGEQKNSKELPGSRRGNFTDTNRMANLIKGIEDLTKPRVRASAE